MCSALLLRSPQYQHFLCFLSFSTSRATVPPADLSAFSLLLFCFFVIQLFRGRKKTKEKTVLPWCLVDDRRHLFVFCPFLCFFVLFFSTYCLFYFFFTGCFHVELRNSSSTAKCLTSRFVELKKEFLWSVCLCVYLFEVLSIEVVQGFVS